MGARILTLGWIMSPGNLTLLFPIKSKQRIKTHISPRLSAQLAQQCKYCLMWIWLWFFNFEIFLVNFVVDVGDAAISCFRVTENDHDLFVGLFHLGVMSTFIWNYSKLELRFKLTCSMHGCPSRVDDFLRVWTGMHGVVGWLACILIPTLVPQDLVAPERRESADPSDTIWPYPQVTSD